MPEIEIVIDKGEIIELNVDARINVHDIVGQLNHDEIFNFIVKLDEQASEWTLTNRLWEHFEGLRKQFLKEFPEQVDETEDSP